LRVGSPAHLLPVARFLKRASDGESSERTGIALHQSVAGRRAQSSRLVIATQDEPNEAAEREPIWHEPGPWRRIVASKRFYKPNSRALRETANELAVIDASLVAEYTAGEGSARCHGEGANSLAPNLMHDVVIGTKSVDETRDSHATEFAHDQCKKPRPFWGEAAVSAGP
jgi:hypothetical protein